MLRQDGQKKFIETETAAQMLGVVLPDNPLTARFQEFLGEQTEYKVVSADQWIGFYRFSHEVRFTLTLNVNLTPTHHLCLCRCRCRCCDTFIDMPLVRVAML